MKKEQAAGSGKRFLSLSEKFFTSARVVSGMIWFVQYLKSMGSSQITGITDIPQGKVEGKREKNPVTQNEMSFFSMFLDVTVVLFQIYF